MCDVPTSIEETQAMLRATGYVCGRSLATVSFLALKLGRPLFLAYCQSDFRAI